MSARGGPLVAMAEACKLALVDTLGTLHSMLARILVSRGSLKATTSMQAHKGHGCAAHRRRPPLWRKSGCQR